ncbi:MAG: hypothetical protein PUC77_09990, partial [Bacteroidales bacterium]|nr:hypothetical protein [Bacteroidales bacterium]
MKVLKFVSSARKALRGAMCVAMLASTMFAWAGDVEQVWPKGKMPDSEPHQIAAMLDEANRPDFDPDRHRVAYIEWMPAPDKAVRTDA